MITVVALMIAALVLLYKAYREPKPASEYIDLFQLLGVVRDQVPPRPAEQIEPPTNLPSNRDWTLNLYMQDKQTQKTFTFTMHAQSFDFLSLFRQFLDKSHPEICITPSDGEPQEYLILSMRLKPGQEPS
jgi:hypothetical protein